MPCSQTMQNDLSFAVRTSPTPMLKLAPRIATSNVTHLWWCWSTIWRGRSKLKNDGVKVSWDDDILSIWKVHNPAMFQTCRNHQPENQLRNSVRLSLKQRWTTRRFSTDLFSMASPPISASGCRDVIMPLSPKWISINDGATPSHHPFYCRIVPNKPTSKLLGDPPLMETPNRPMRRAWPSKSTSWHESLCCRYSCYLSVTETIAEIHRFGKCRAYAISTYINHKRQ